jgi:hypothetical protein
MTAASGRILDIDHLMVHVRDCEAAGRAFEELGFKVTPKSGMPELGLSNRCILFQPENDAGGNYIELMAIEDPDRAPPFMKAILGDDEGPASLVLSTDDVDLAAGALRDRGVACFDPFQVRREWRLGPDDVVHPAFGVCIPEPGRFDPYWNLVHFHTPELYRRADLVAHPNGLRHLREVCVPVADPAAAAADISEGWRVGAEAAGGDWTVRPGAVALRLVAGSGPWTVRLTPGEGAPGLADGSAELFGLTFAH